MLSPMLAKVFAPSVTALDQRLFGPNVGGCAPM
jgi:hypothetical protein